jgi:predicted HTH domain antitoxin
MVEKSVVGRNKAFGHLEDMKVEIELPDVTEDQPYVPQGGTKKLLVELACRLFEKDVITFGQGCEMSGLGFFEFQAALADREISRYTHEMLEEDMKYVRGQ